MRFTWELTLDHLSVSFRKLEYFFIFSLQSIVNNFFFASGIDLTNENPHKQTNLENIQTLTKTTRITALDFGEDETEILVGRVEPIVKVYETPLNAFTATRTFENGPIVGVGKFDGKIIAGLANGRIQIGHKKSTFLETGDAMSRMRQCRQDRKLIASGGKERQNNLKVWNLETNECIFRTKNVPNDFLQLEVPIWDTDFGFIDANCLSTCSRYGYIRVYDMREQRRPVFNYSNDKEQIGYSCITLHGGDVVFAGTTTGVMHAFDLRKMKHVLHTYKGFTGSITDVGIDKTGKYLYSASLDRFVRVHHAETTALQYQCYVKSKATRVLLRECAPVEIKQEKESDDEQEANLNGSTSAGQYADEGEDDDEFDKMFDQMQTVM